MGAPACSITYNVKDRNGNVKVSQLWKDLADLFKGDRRNLMAHFFLTKDSRFLSENSDVLEFDVDGEVTIASFKKAMERDGEYSDLSNAKILAKLNEELEDKKFDYSEALDNVLKFNRSDQFRDGFLATLKRGEDGKYTVSVVERNPQSEYELADHVMNKILTDSIRLILQDKGLSVDFLDNAAYAAKYSTNSPHYDADGYLAVAEVFNGINTSANTAEVAGHFLAAAMEGNPLMDRLLSTLTPEVQMAIFKNKESALYRPEFTVSDYSAKEAAGILIGRQLIQPFKDAQKTKMKKELNARSLFLPGGVVYILSKIGSYLKSLFSKDSVAEVNKLVQQAKDAASTVAQGFIENPDTADVNQALNNHTTYTSFNVAKHLSKSARQHAEAFYESLASLKDTVIRLSTSIKRTDNPINSDIYTKLQTIVSEISTAYSPQVNMEAFATQASLEGMVTAIEGIIYVMDHDVRSLLNSIQPSDRVASYANLSSNARSMQTLNTTVKNVAQLYQILLNKLDNLSSDEKAMFLDKDNNRVSESLREAVKRLGDILVGNEETYVGTTGESQKVNGLQALMELKRRQIFIDALRNFYGEDFINMNCGKVFQQTSKGVFGLRLMPLVKKKSIADFVDSLDSDISWFDRYLSSAADCGDFVTAVGDKVTKQANMQADRYAFQFWDRLEELRIQMQNAFGNTDCRPFYETIVSKLDYDAWKRDRKEMEDSLKGTSNFEARMEEWHEQHSDIYYEKGAKKYRPKESEYWNESLEGTRELTGNLISRVNHGAWEKARREFREQLKKDFYNYLAEMAQKAYENNKNVPGYVFELTDEQKGILYHSFVDPQWEQWHAEHSEEDTSGKSKKWVPNHIKYHNTQWDELFDTENPSLTSEEKAQRRKRLHIFEDIMTIKGDMDSLLGTGNAVLWRAPQMTGRFGHRLRNLRAKFNSSNKAAAGRALIREVQDNFVIRPDEAWMFGSNNDYCEIEEDPLENPLYFEKEKINRLPIFGVQKLKNMEDLSTDLFGTLTQYGSMAATYKAMEQVVDIFELGKDVLKQRKVGNKTDANRDTQSRAYNRYIKFIEKSIYGLNVERIKYDRKGAFTKFINGLSSLGGRILLAGNIPGGIVNTGTGMLEVFKEAASEENFTISDLNEAHKIYFDGIVGTAVNGLMDAQRPEDKNSLWIRHWNIRSENQAFLRNQKYDTKAMSLIDNRLWEWYGHTLMLPYSSGDHYMQTIPYYAMGLHEKVYDHSGKRMSLMDAYEIVDGDEVFAIDNIEGTSPAIGRNHKKIRLKEGIFKSVENINKYDTFKDIRERIANFFLTHPAISGTTPIDLEIIGTDGVKYLQKEGLTVPTTVKQLESLGNALESKMHELMFNSTDESEFMDKCRNICNRLHGIYNNEDKTAWQQHWFGNLVMSMRGYALGMINRRYAPSKYNVPQRKVVEGSYNTAFKMFASAFFDINNMDNWKAVLESAVMIPFGGLGPLFSKSFGNRLKADMIKAGFSEHQYYNIRRTSADFLVLEALFLLKLLSSPGAHFGLSDDDDDEDKTKRTDNEDNWGWGLLYYFTNRWFNEQGAFTVPGVMLYEGNSLLDYMPNGISGFLSLMNIAKMGFDTGIDKATGEDLSNSELYYQSTKDGKYEVGDAKWWIKAKQLMPYVRSWYTITHPYSAAEGYEYGRKTKSR